MARTRICILLIVAASVQNTAWWWDIVRAGDLVWRFLFVSWSFSTTAVCVLAARDLGLFSQRGPTVAEAWQWMAGRHRPARVGEFTTKGGR